MCRNPDKVLEVYVSTSVRFLGLFLGTHQDKNLTPESRMNKTIKCGQSSKVGRASQKKGFPGIKILLPHRS